MESERPKECGKRRREEAKEEESGSVKSKVKIDYGHKDGVIQGGPSYAEIALVCLVFLRRFGEIFHISYAIGTTPRGLPLHT